MKVLGWFGKLLASALLISFLSVMTTAYLVDQYVSAVLERFQLTNIERPSLDLSDLLFGANNPGQHSGSQLSGEAAVASAQTDGREEAVEASAEPDSESTAPSEAEADTDAGLEADIEADSDVSGRYDDPGGDALPVFGQSSVTRSADSIVMSAEQFNEARKKLTDDDKLVIFTIVMNKLPQDELQNMSQLLEDGITELELEQLERVIYTHLQEDDIAKLLAILNKY